MTQDRKDEILHLISVMFLCTVVGSAIGMAIAVALYA
jgi:hypothetical protein